MSNVTLDKVYGSLPLELSMYSALIQNVCCSSIVSQIHVQWSEPLTYKCIQLWQVYTNMCMYVK